MTDTYNDTTGSRKKFLIPLVVLLLCAVSLTGAGYAYNATVTNLDNTTDVDGVTLELFENNASTPVKHAMYTVDDINVATHTTNGKAIKYNATPASAIGFLTEAAKVDARAEKVVDAPANYDADMANFKDGYYVETLKGDVPAGYHDAISIATITDNESLAAAPLTKIGDNYKLQIVNASGAAVKIQADVDAADVIAFAGINEVYLVLKDSEGNFVGIVGSTGGYADIATGIANGADTTYTVEAYLALTDFYSEEAPTIPASPLVFNVFFKTV